MKKYLRFGEIPKNERSINFLKMNFSQKDDFTWYKETHGIDEAMQHVPEKALENGVSVFEMGKDGMPILHNMRECNSLACRIGYKIYQVTGDEVGHGNDGEPLIRSVVVEKSRRIKDSALIRHILSFMAQKFMLVIPPKENYEPSEEYKIYHNFKEFQVNFDTNEVKERVFSPDDGFTPILGHTYFGFCGWEFHFPVAGFDSNPLKN